MALFEKQYMGVDYKILVTIGTTSWDDLMRYIDKTLGKKYKIFYQIADGNYVPNTGTSERFISNFQSFCGEFDIIITHAGAGTVYNLLESNSLLVVIPNVDRIDKHQLELADFIDRENLAAVAYCFEEIEEKIDDIIRGGSNFESYKKEEFFLIEDILALIQ